MTAPAGSNSRFREVVIGDLMAEFHDGPHATPKPAASGPVFLGIKNISVDGRLDLSNVRHIGEADFPRWTRRATPRSDDIVFTYEATLHRYAVIPAGFRGCLGRRLALIRPRRDVVDPRFLHFALLGPEWRRTVEDRVISGATVDRVPLTDFPSFPISIPPLDVQARISSFLGTFNELIEINDRRIQLLEHFARRLYREWFVRFRLPAPQSARFVDSDAGQIPEGWTAAPLFEVADVGFGHSFKSSGFGDAGPHPVVRIRDVPRGQTKTFTDEPVQPRHMVRDGDILIGMDGEFHLNRWSGGIAWLNQRVARLRPLNGLSSGHLLQAVAEPLRIWNDTIVGTTVAHLGKRHLELIRVLVPPPTLLSKVTRAFDAISEHELLLRRANQRLAQTRDLLLPRLVTGRLDISEIDLGDLLPDADAA